MTELNNSISCACRSPTLLRSFPPGPNWPLQQLAQAQALKLANVGMATAMDLGDPTSPNGAIHPENKQG